MTKDPNGELVIRYGKSGKVYFVHYHPKSGYDVYIEKQEGFVSVEVKAAAIDCGAPNDPTKGGRWYGKYLMECSELAAAA